MTTAPVIEQFLERCQLVFGERAQRLRCIVDQRLQALGALLYESYARYERLYLFQQVAQADLKVQGAVAGFGERGWRGLQGGARRESRFQVGR